MDAEPGREQLFSVEEVVEELSATMPGFAEAWKQNSGFPCRECGTTEDSCQAAPAPCCIVCSEFNVSPHQSVEES